MSIQRFRNYLNELTNTDLKTYMIIIDTGISANEIKSQIDIIDSNIEPIDQNIKNS